MKNWAQPLSSRVQKYYNSILFYKKNVIIKIIVLILKEKPLNNSDYSPKCLSE